MAEAEELCDRIAIINHGRIVALDTPASLKKQITGETLFEVEVRTGDLTGLQADLQKLDGSLQMQVGEAPPNKKVSIRTKQPEEVMQILTPFISSKQVQGLEVRNQTLEDVYVSIIQKVTK